MTNLWPSRAKRRPTTIKTKSAMPDISLRILLLSEDASSFFSCSVAFFFLCRLLCRLFMKLLRRASGDIRLQIQMIVCWCCYIVTCAALKWCSILKNAFCGISPNLFSLFFLSSRHWIPVSLWFYFISLLRLAVKCNLSFDDEIVAMFRFSINLIGQNRFIKLILSHFQTMKREQTVFVSLSI